jgi:hypothetical protein
MGTRSLQSGSVKLTIKATIQNLLTDGQIASASHDVTPINTKFDSGLNADEANRVWEDRDRALSSGANETLDLYSFVGLNIGAGDNCDALGQALTIEEIVTICITNENEEGDAGFLEIEPGAVNAFNALGSHTVANGGALGPGASLVKHFPGSAGMDLSSTKKNIKLTANGGAVDYSIYIIGRDDDDESSSTSTSSLSSSTSTSTSSVSSTSSQSSLSSSSSTSSVSSSSTSSISSSSSSSTSSASSSSSSLSSSSSSSS